MGSGQGAQGVTCAETKTKRASRVAVQKRAGDGRPVQLPLRNGRVWQKELTWAKVVGGASSSLSDSSLLLSEAFSTFLAWAAGATEPAFPAATGPFPRGP